jgi:ankyrin repeat protein
VVLGLTVVTMVGVTAFYVLDNIKERKEFAEERREEFELKSNRYKSFKDFVFNQKYGLSRSLSLLKTGNVAGDAAFEESFSPIYEKLKKTSSKDFTNEDQAYDALGPDGKREYVRKLVIEGKRDLFHHFIERGETSFTLTSLSDTGKTLLHYAVEKKHLVLVEEMLGVSATAANRLLKGDWQQVPGVNKDRKQIAENYKQLNETALQLLTMRDNDGFLPLHYAANMRDSSLYRLLLEQPVPYTKEDLEKAETIRKKWIKDQKSWLLTSALIESVCPGNSVPEIVNSLSFAAIVIASTALSGVIGFTAVAVYILVCIGNFHRSKVERGISSDLEQLALDNAKIDCLKLRINTLQKKVSNNPSDPTVRMSADDIFNAKSELTSLISELGALRKTYPQQDIASPKNVDSTFKAKCFGFLKTFGRGIRTYGGALGTFLCGYAGTLGIIELVVTAGALTVTGPVGWGLLGLGAFVGLVFAGFNLKNRLYDTKIFAARHKKVAEDKAVLGEKVSNAALGSALDDIFLSLDLKGVSQQAIMQEKLSKHQPHPGCDLLRPVNGAEAEVVADVQAQAQPAQAPVEIGVQANSIQQQPAADNLTVSVY